jgi:hypothetical protein
MPRSKKAVLAATALFTAAAAAVPAPAEKTKTVKKDEKEPTWYELHYILSEVGNRLLKSLTKREDMPPDVTDLLEGILALREAKDLFYAEKTKLTPFTALFWAEELQKWAAKDMEMPDGVHVRRAMMEVDTDEIPFADEN